MMLSKATSSKQVCCAFSALRVLSTRAATEPAPEVKFQDEWDNAKPYSEIPGPSTFEVIRRFMPGGKWHGLGMMQFHKAMRQEYGDIGKLPGLLGRPEVLMSHPVESREKIFRFNGKYPRRIGLDALQYYRETVRPDVYAEYQSLLSSKDEEWWKVRQLINPVMLKPTTVKLYVPQVDEIAKDFIKLITDKRDANNEVPSTFQNFLNMWSLESITCITLNQRLGILDPNNQEEKPNELIKYINRFFVLSYDIEMQPAIWKYYATKDFKELMAVCDGMTNIILYYVDKAVEDLNTKPKRNDGEEESILEKLAKINKNLAVVMCSDALMAGVDTTSTAATMILYCLAKNQDKQDKLREELRRLLPNRNEPLTTEKMKNMPYMRAVIKEGIRMYPPTSGNVRKVAEDLVLSGYQIPKGTEVAMSIFSDDEEQFAQAKQFIPERWLKNNTDASCPRAKDAHPFTYLPFGFGSRMCVGRRLAEMEIEVLLARLVQNYKIEWNYPEIEIKSAILNLPQGELKFKLTEV